MTTTPAHGTNGAADQVRVALVTSANKGLGREIARRLAVLGMTVLATARDEDRGRRAAGELAAGGADVRFLRLDVTDQASVAAAAGWVERQFGHLDVLVNNAGISLDRQRPPSQIGADDMRRAPAARVVNLSTPLGSVTLLANPDRPEMGPDLLAYCSSKAALNAVTVIYANELRGTPIKVNAVNPGYVATDLNHHSGYRTVEQGATIAVQLATVGADDPTGAFFSEDGPIPW